MTTLTITSPAACAAAEKRLGIAPPRTAPKPPEEQARRAERQVCREEQVRQLEAPLRERFPAAFRVPRPPLAIGIDRQILEHLGDDAKAPGRFLRSWVNRPPITSTRSRTSSRGLINLDGSFPTPDQQQDAAGRVYVVRAEAVLARTWERMKAAAD
jgi:hypothetical protein